jgi:hypothetical protein
MANDPLAHPMIREVQAAIRSLEKAVTHQEVEIACLALTGHDTARDREVLDMVRGTLAALRTRLAMIHAAISSTQDPT